MVANSAGRRQTSRVVVGALLWGALTFAATWLILRIVDDELTSNPEAAAPQLRILIWLVVGGGSVLALSRSQLAALTAGVLGVATFVAGMAMASTLLTREAASANTSISWFTTEISRTVALAYFEPGTMVLTGVFLGLGLWRLRK